MKLFFLSSILGCLFLGNFSSLQAQTDSTYRPAVNTEEWNRFSEDLQALLIETRDSLRLTYQQHPKVSKGLALVMRESLAGRGKEETQFTEAEQAAVDTAQIHKEAFNAFIMEVSSVLFLKMGAKTSAHQEEILQHIKEIYGLEGVEARQIAPLFILEGTSYLTALQEAPEDIYLTYILHGMAFEWQQRK